MKKLQEYKRLLEMYEMLQKMYSKTPIFFFRFLSISVYKKLQKIESENPRLASIARNVKITEEQILSSFDPLEIMFLSRNLAVAKLELVLKLRNDSPFIYRKAYEKLIKMMLKELWKNGHKICIDSMSESWSVMK